MANGKIIYTPITTVALSFAALNYLSCAAAALNAGTDKFGVDVLFAIDPFLTGVDCQFILAGKGPLDLANAAGWHLYYNPGRRRLGFRINDGGAAPVVVESADNQIPVLGDNMWARMQMDRSGLGQLFAQGLPVASGDISNAAGSLDNSEPFCVGGLPDAPNNHWGTIDLVRFDLGRVLSAAWHEEEWQRLRYGCSRRAEDFEDFLAVWTWFGESLSDAAGTYELTWEGDGEPVFVAGWPGSSGEIAYLFEDNFNTEGEPGYLKLDDEQRLADGSDYTTPAPNPKKTFTLNFQLIETSQQAALEAAWAGQNPVKLYLDADKPKEPGTYRIREYPLIKYLLAQRMDAKLYMEQV